MKLASGFCIPEPLPVHTGIKGRQVHPLILFLLRIRVDEKCADLHKPFISYLFLVGVTVQSAESLSAGILLGTSTKRANHGRSRLFQDSVSSMSFWLRSTSDVGRQCATPCFRILAGTVRGRCTSRRTSGQSRLGPRDFGEDVSERTDFCTIHPTPFRCTTTGTLIVPLEPLAQRLEEWFTLPSLSRWLTRTIRLGYAIQFARWPPKFNGVLETSVAVRNAPVLREEIAVLLAKDAIEPVPPAKMRQGFHSPYFIVPKKGGQQPILDRRVLNRALHKLPFKMLTRRCIIKCIQPQD